jgi:protein-S-isoprenylcysteine O-methyltransferase Ste14
MFSLFIRNLFFTLLQPGIVAGLIPYWIVHRQGYNPLESPFQITHYIGLLIFTLGWYLTIDCIYRFAVYGNGTLSPADPTKKLVINGWYRYTRNPMYVGVMMILLGEVIFFRSTQLLFYTLFVMAAFTVFIIVIEEPRLKRDFGEEYLAYSKRVRRWI